MQNTSRLKGLLCSSLCLLLSLIPQVYAKESINEEPLIAKARRSIVKINAIRQNIDFMNPWLFSPSQALTGSGFFIEGRRILTNAHVVSNTRFITVQKDGDSRQYNAYVEYIAHDCDLAVLNVKEKEFFAGLKPLPLGDVPRLRSPVSAIGYPAGGEQIAVTKGIVSRIDYSLYAHTDFHFHLLIQVDSAINPGASGGPVLQNGKVVGVAFQAFRAAQNIGYIIPVPIIKRFLKDISSGTYKGHIETGLIGRAWLTDNRSTALFHNVHEGYKLIEVTPWSPYKNKIQRGDIILEIDGQRIGPDGNIAYHGERLSFFTLFDLKLTGDNVTLKIKRGEEILKVNLKVQAPQKHPFVGRTYKKHPRYIIFGGLVFTELSQNYLETWGDEWMRRIPAFFRYLFSHSDEDEEFASKNSLIVLSKRLPHEINQYAEGFQNSLVKTIDDKPIDTFEGFHESLKNSKGKFLKIEFFGREDTLYLPMKDLKEIQEQINTGYGVHPDVWLDRTKDAAISWGEKL
jgi:S1-C subfamily serine protease